MHGPLGLIETEEAVYLSLLKGRGSSVDELVREVGAAPKRTRAPVARLKGLGFVTHSPGSPARLTPVPLWDEYHALLDRLAQDRAAG